MMARDGGHLFAQGVAERLSITSNQLLPRLRQRQDGEK